MTFSVAGLQQFFLILVRSLGIIALAPVLGSGRYAVEVKVGFAIALAAILSGMQPAPDAPWTMLGLAGAVSQEVVVGLLTGFASRVTFTGLEMAATYVGLQAGFGMSSHLNPNLADVFQQSGSAIEQVYMLMVGLTFLAVDAHHWVLLGIQRTLEVVPPGTLALSPLGLERITQLTGTLFTTALFVSIPVLGTLLLVDVSLGLVSRAVPQVQVFFVGAPLKIGLGIVTLGVALPWIASYIVDKFAHLVDEMLIFVAA